MPVIVTHRASIGSGDSPKSNSFPDITTPQDPQEEEEIKHSAELSTHVYRPHPFSSRLVPSGITSLYSGSTFKGHQTSGKLSYAVKVELKVVSVNISCFAEANQKKNGSLTSIPLFGHVDAPC
jgi:hypothetical protein